MTMDADIEKGLESVLLGPKADPAVAHEVRPPARSARRAALALSATAVAFSFVCGATARRALRNMENDELTIWLVLALSFLLGALLLRMCAAVCELVWLERTWHNVPVALRKVGPVDRVGTFMLVGFSLVPGVAWFWKLGLVAGIVDGFEHIRAETPFRAPIPRRLGLAAVIVGWIPGLNVYLAPFMWEVFATRVDAACQEILALRAGGDRPG